MIAVRRRVAVMSGSLASTVTAIASCDGQETQSEQIVLSVATKGGTCGGSVSRVERAGDEEIGRPARR